LHDEVDDVMLLVALEHDVLGLGMRLERGVEDLLLDDLVDRELTLDGREELGADLEAPLRGRLELGHQLPHLGVVVEQHGDRVHGWASGDRWDWGFPYSNRPRCRNAPPVPSLPTQLPLRV